MRTPFSNNARSFSRTNVPATSDIFQPPPNYLSIRYPMRIQNCRKNGYEEMSIKKNLKWGSPQKIATVYSDIIQNTCHIQIASSNTEDIRLANLLRSNSNQIHFSWEKQAHKDAVIKRMGFLRCARKKLFPAFQWSVVCSRRIEWISWRTFRMDNGQPSMRPNYYAPTLSDGVTVIPARVICGKWHAVVRNHTFETNKWSKHSCNNFEGGGWSRRSKRFTFSFSVHANFLFIEVFWIQ